MRKSKIKIPGYEDLEFDEYSEPIDLTEDPDKFLERLHKEKEYDQKLDAVAEGIAEVAENAIRSNRSQLFWDVGNLLLPYQERVSSASGRLPKYEQLKGVLERVKEKVGKHVANAPGIDRKTYGVPYLLKMIRVREKFTREELEGADYPQVQELIHNYLSDEDRRSLLARVKSKEFADFMEVRALVKEAMHRPSRPRPELPPSEIQASPSGNRNRSDF
jgi:hypothetical protein